MGDKYDAPPVLFTAFLHLRDLVVEAPVHVFGAAVAYGNLDLARHALKRFDHTYVRIPRPGTSQEAYVISGSTRHLADVPARFIERFSRVALLSFVRLQEGVYEGKWTWKSKADEFVVSPSHRC